MNNRPLHILVRTQARACSEQMKQVAGTDGGRLGGGNVTHISTGVSLSVTHLF
jgi:hypothetical protein